MFRRFALFVALLFCASPSLAYWEYGHETVASIAMSEVKPQTRAAIRQLLAQQKLLETPTCPARTLEEASVWADCVKPLGERFSYAYSWHYQNVNVCQPFDLKSACKDGHCVSAQIERNLKLLADKSVPTRERVMALAFLTHFVGDLHQPLHAGDKGDLGGNRFGVDYGVIGGRTNAHSIWDGYLADRAITTPEADARGLLGEVAPADRPALAAGTVEDWSREMWEQARTYAYGSLLPDPCATPEGRPVMTEEKVRALIPVARGQVLRAGLRLARLLDEALGI